MPRIFEIKDKSGRVIYLTDERWNHITTEHPLLANNVEDIKDALVAHYLLGKANLMKM